MRFYHIAVFIFAVNLALGFVNTIPLDTLGNSLDESQFGIGEDNELNITRVLDNGWNASAQNLGVNNLGFGDIPGGFNMWKILSDSTVTMNLMLERYGLPSTLALIFAGLANVSYLAGAVQLWTGRDIET